MRVLYFTRDYTPHDHRFLSALASSGHEIYFLRLERREASDGEPGLPTGVEAISWRGGRAPARLSDGPALLFDLKRVVKRIHPDVVHAGPIQTSAFLTAEPAFIRWWPCHGDRICYSTPSAGQAGNGSRAIRYSTLLYW